MSDMKNIIYETAQEFNVDPSMLSKQSKKREIVKARREAIVRCRIRTEATLMEIGKMFNRNHSTIIYSLHIDSLKENNEEEIIENKMWDCKQYRKCLTEVVKNGELMFGCKSCEKYEKECEE